MGMIHDEEIDLKNIFHKFKKRDFSGNSGQAIKNSGYQLTTNIVMKVGSLLFTIILARMLMPELFGLYSLALGTVILFSAFSDLGISSATITFISKKIGEKDPAKAKAYFKKLLKWKIYLLIISSIALLFSGYFIANYYDKPIFYALLAGGLYLPIVGLLGFFETSFKASNNFRYPLFKEILFQSTRFVLIPLSIFLLLKMDLTNNLLVGLLILIIVGVYCISAIFLGSKLRKKTPFLKAKENKLSGKELKDLRRFILPLTAMALSGIFFGYIDTIMLGHYVSSEFISYYGSVFSLIGSAAAIIGFTSIALFPIFSKMKGLPLEKMFKKTRNITILIGIVAAIFTYFLAFWIIKIAYGSAYLAGVPLLKWFAVLIVILPISGLYDSYFISKKKTGFIAKLLIFTTILNIALNYFGITYGLKFGMFEAVLGACFATIFSRIVYFIGIVIIKRR